MDTKECLLNIQRLQKQIDTMKSQVAYYREAALSTSSPVFDKIGSSGTRATEPPFAKLINKAVDLEALIPEREYELENYKQIIKLVIGELEPKLRQVIELRYFENLSWEKIAGRMNYSNKTIRRWHDLAIGLIHF